MRENKNFGFTLIELLVVVAVIGLLASVVFVALNSARVKSRDAKRLGDLRQIRSAFALLLQEKGKYPGDPASYYAVSNNNYESAVGCSDPNEALNPYIPNVCSLTGPFGVSQADVYYYVVTNNNQGFRLGARFELAANQGAPFLAGDGTPIAGVYEPK